MNLEDFRGKRILIIGDVMVDEYKKGIVERISPEAPVPVVSIEETFHRIRGAGNVANNIKALGGIPILVGVIGYDYYGDLILELMEEEGLDKTGIIREKGRKTTVKTRIVAHNQQVVRVDIEDAYEIKKDTENKILDHVFSFKDRIDGIVFEDYDKGCLTSNLISKTISKFKDKTITVDPKFRNFFSFQGISLFKPNLREMEKVLGKELNNEKSILDAGFSLQKNINSPVLVTMGSKGMALFYSGKHKLFPSMAREVYDVSGAGDTVIATATLALTAGFPIEEAVYVSNIAAGIEVGKFGVATVTLEELKKEYDNKKGRH